MHDDLECARSERRLDAWCKDCLCIPLEHVTLAAIEAFDLADDGYATRGQAAKFIDALRQRGWDLSLNMDRAPQPFTPRPASPSATSQ